MMTLSLSIYCKWFGLMFFVHTQAWFMIMSQKSMFNVLLMADGFGAHHMFMCWHSKNVYTYRLFDT